VIVFDEDFVGMSLFPTESDAVLVVHADTVAASTAPLQAFEPIAGWNREVLQPRSDVEHLQLPSHDGSKHAWNVPGAPSVPFTEQVSGGLVGEALNHVAITYYTGNR
jgi:hypothetical protein